MSAFFSYADGLTGTFIISTGEAPGTNRLEVAAERGWVVLEGGQMSYWRNETAMGEFSRRSTQSFAQPEAWGVRLPTLNSAGCRHNEILNNFVAAAAEGIHSAELANAMIYSSLQR